MSKSSLKRIGIAILVALFLLVCLIRVFSRMLGNITPIQYAGEPLEYWQNQLNSRETGVSNQAFATVHTLIIPQLVDRMFHDTNDSRLRLSLINTLNGLPGVQIDFIPADSRRAIAVETIGDFGPAAEAAIPDLIKALKGNDANVYNPAISALGKIHGEPDTVIPLLIACLDNNGLNNEAAFALASYGSRAKAAVPKIIPMLRLSDDAEEAARYALLRIDPAAAAAAGVNAGPLMNEPAP